MADRSTTVLPGGELRVRGPGVTVAQPVVDETRVVGVAIGITGFLGYAQARDGRSWPIQLSAEDQIDQALELPEWGLLRPALRSFFRNGGRVCMVVGLEADAVHSPIGVICGGGPGNRSGLTIFDLGENVELLAFPDLYRVPPGATAPGMRHIVATHQAITAFCSGLGGSSRGGYFAILDAPPGLNERQASVYARKLSGSATAEFASLYYPWLEVDSGRGELMAIPPCGSVAGIYSEMSSPASGGISSDKGPHQSVANRALADAISAQTHVSRAESWRLMDEGINPIIPWPGRGMTIWGARTLSKDTNRNHVTVRRILSYVRRSIYLGTRWAVFEANNSILWLRLTAYIQDFLERLRSAGVLIGATAEEAYSVRCDGTTNPTREVDAGRLNVLVAVRPTRSLEHIVVRIFHQRAQTSSDNKEE